MSTSIGSSLSLTENYCKFDSSWSLLGHVDSAVYGTPNSGITRRQVLEKYQVYGDSVLWRDGKKPNVRDVVKPLFGLFHSAPGNSLWKRKADTAFQHCTTLKAFFEETLDAFPDFVLDTPIAGPPPPKSENIFARVRDILPPPYESEDEELMYA